VAGAASHQRLGVKGDAHAGQIEHGKIIRAVAHGDHLIKRDIFLFGEGLQQLGLPVPIHDFAGHCASYGAVLDLKFIGEYVIESEQLLQMLAEEGEAAGEHGGFVSQRLQCRYQAFGAVG